MERLSKDPRLLEHPGTLLDFGEEKWGFMLLNMGGPEKAEDARAYLYNIFADPNLIPLRLPMMVRRPLARFMAHRRSPKVARRYQAIGGGSPLLKWTRLVASGVKRELSKKYPHVEAFVGMRYFEPYIPEELDAAVGEGCRHIVLVSMYPQYCRATTGTALQAVREWLEDREAQVTLSVIDSWYDRPEYISLLRRRIEAALEKVDRSKAKIIFSAHSIPQRLARRQPGDPYLEQIQKTAAAAGAGWDYILAFQSRLGPIKWVGPDLVSTVRRLAKDGVTEMVLVPISFVSDHIETLYEIDLQLSDAARRSGVKKFVRTESFNDDPRFMEFLAGLIEEKIASRC